MPAPKTATEPRYTVWAGNTLTGSAESILRRVKEGAAEGSEIRKLTLDEYASVLVDDAAYFLPAGVLEFLKAQSYETRFDEALQYLAAMPASGVRILSKK